MDKVRVGIIGIGNMGTAHSLSIFNGLVKGAELTAICDIKDSRLQWAKDKFGDKVQLFDNATDLFRSGFIDAVFIATPHYDHPTLAIEAFNNNLHVLIEKPAGVFTKKVREMNEVAVKTDRVFGIMYNQRTNPIYIKLKELVDSGELGEIRRTNWIITNWYRSQSYYNSGGWRATWEGEGGGVLLNQDPHQLDLWQWICGMPVRVRAFCGFGKGRNIEVETDVTAYVEYDNGATGVFVTSVIDTPGTNRFEITGDKGKIVVEDDKITLWRNKVSEAEFNNTYMGGFGQPECCKCEIPVEGTMTAHVGILNDWIKSIQKGSKLLAPGIEGIRGLTISNAMHLSSWTNSTVELPLDEDLYYELLQDKIRNSNFKKDNVVEVVNNVNGTF